METPMSASATGITKRGIELLHDPRLNKSTGFTEAERRALGLIGLVPDVTESIETQLSRVLLQLKDKTTDLDRFIHLMNLLETNQTLFYHTLMSDPARFLYIVYDPTIGEACLKFDHIFRRPLGMYLSMSRKGQVKEVLRNWPVKDVRVICVTNSGRILGLGDLGANGMGIPIGKLQLYTAVASAPPEGLLPMYLDSGTNNESYLRDPLCLGLRQHRPSTEKLYAFVDEFMEAVPEFTGIAGPTAKTGPGQMRSHSLPATATRIAATMGLRPGCGQDPGDNDERRIDKSPVASLPGAGRGSHTRLLPDLPFPLILRAAVPAALANSLGSA